MDYRDGLPGIAGDRKFIDALYVYQKSKQDLKNIEDEDGMKREKTKYICCIYYLKALEQVFSKIYELSEGKNNSCYLDYVRWNRDIIDAEFNHFKCIPDLQNIIRITEYENVCKSIFEKYFQLTTNEKRIVRQYVEDIKCVKRYAKPYEKSCKLALKHTGRLFINYVNILRTRGYTKELDRHNVTFENFQDKARDLITRLEDVDDNLKTKVREAFESFKDYRDFDDRCAKINDELIAEALELAQSRAIAIQEAKGAAKTQEKKISRQNEQEILEGKNALRRLFERIHRNEILEPNISFH
uniref:Uncharacterized protein n=1 Tax=Panagrolaimus sp. JU765 TaxID=591449 RepID=A0AC34QA91_9BILA